MAITTSKRAVPIAALWGVLLSVSVISCGGGGGSSDGASDSGQSPALSGSIADFGIAGLSFTTPTVSGTTGTRGSYSYRCTTTCEAVTFKLGGIVFGTATAAPTLTLRELQGGLDGGVLSEATIRRVQLLVALDADAEPTNGITLPQDVSTSLATRAIDFNATSFDADLESLLTFLRGDNRLSSTYRAGLRAPTRAVARALAEQFEAIARGVFVETPTSANSVVEQVRKYVVRHPDSLLVPYSGSSSTLKTTYPQGLRAAVGAGLTLASDSSAANIRLRVVSARGVAITAPQFFDGTSARPASILLDATLSGGPSVGIITLSSTAAELNALAALRTADGAVFSGRPTPTDSSGSDGARNLDEALQPRNPEFDQRGLDLAGVVEGESSTSWLCDRRGPFLLQLDAQGRVVQRLGPAGNAGSLPDVARRLPAILESRQATLGCGGLAARTSSGELLMAVGAALDVGGRTANTARLIRLVGFNPKTNAVRQFAMPIRDNESGLRVLDLESLSEQRVLALVRYRDGGPTGPYRFDIRTIDLTTATDVSTKTLSSGPNAGLALEYGSLPEIAASGVTLASIATVVELGSLGWIAENAEGLARIDANTLVVVSQANGGVTGRVLGGSTALSVGEHQVDRNGVITPRATGSTSAPTFELLPMPAEARQTVLWSIKLRNGVN
jgi:Esterase-like activity of phytase